MKISDIPEIYRDRKVLITGHTGFKGSWLSIWLNDIGAKVAGYSLEPNTKPNNYELCHLNEKIDSNIGDLRDESSLRKALKKNRPEIIFHLAAQPIVRLSYDEPKMTYETNIMGLINLFEAARETESVRAIVVITSDKCYENKEWEWGYRETDELGGYDPYSSSKACAEIVTKSYRRSFFNLPNRNVLVASTRAGNVIGGGDWSPDRIIPDIMRAIQDNQILELRFPNAERPWQHVLEPLAGYLKLGAYLLSERESFQGAWNFGPAPSEVLTVEELVKCAYKCWGLDVNYRINNTNSDLHESNYLQLDSSKAYRKLKWKAILSVREAVCFTIDWYKHYYENRSDAFELCQSQINKYNELAKTQNL